MVRMNISFWRRFQIAAVAPIFLTSLISSSGCAHRGVGPVVTAPAGLSVEHGRPPACFSAPLAECVDSTAPVSPERRFGSRWLYPFHPDLHHRVCRGDAAARERFLDGARSLGCTEGAGCAWPVYLDFLAGCSSAGFCEWASGVAEDGAEDRATRRLLLEGVRRGCRGVLAKERYDGLGADLLEGGRPLGDQPPWTTSSQESRCAALEAVDDPWEDLAARHGAGCLDLDDWVDWIGDHRNDRAGVAATLERCVDRREIRYREADCLRALAGLDRDRAVAFLRGDDRRGWGMSSTINRYARTLLRFPARGELEARMGSLGLLPAGSKTPSSPNSSSPGAVEILPQGILPQEILEAHGRLLRFSPACPERYCEHAPLLYRLAQLASPELDDLVIAERWPRREEVDLGSGSRGVSTTLRGIPVTFRVAAAAAGAGDDGSPGGSQGGAYDPEDFERLRAAALEALEAPHEITIYDRGRVYRLPVRQLDGWYDLEALLGGLNSVLAHRGSPLRATALEPHCIPCAQVVVGPIDGLIEAAFDGLIEVTDPFRELWTHRQFDPGRLVEAGE